MGLFAFRLLTAQPEKGVVLETASLLWGIVAEAFLVLTYIPGLSPLVWFDLSFSGLGILFSLYAMISTKARTGSSIVGFVFCVMVLVLSIVRLVIGAATF